CGMKLVSTKQYKNLFSLAKSKPCAYIYSIDQSPRKGSGYRMEFLNQDSMVLFGTERTAKNHNLPIVFGSIRKVKRGYFEIEYEKIIENPSEYKDGEITEIITRRLEKHIYEAPEYWLWTHKRWKHTPINRER
ncbi:MAG: KDO2-lipid IV(A) lauroyltransferase, partial [Glaciecola sp.]